MRPHWLIAGALGVLISGYMLLGCTLKDQNNICLPIFTGCTF